MSKFLLLISIFICTPLFSQVDEIDKLRKQEEEFRQKQKEAEERFAKKIEQELTKIELEYLEYEKKREQEILEWEGKNIDPSLREKALAIETKYPSEKSFLPNNALDKSIILQLEETEKQWKTQLGNNNQEKNEEASTPNSELKSSLEVDPKNNEPDRTKFRKPSSPSEEGVYLTKEENSSGVIQEPSAPTSDVTMGSSKEMNENNSESDLSTPTSTTPVIAPLTPSISSDSGNERKDEADGKVEDAADSDSVSIDSMRLSLTSYTKADAIRLKEEMNANRPIIVPLSSGTYRISSPFNPNRMHPVLNKKRPHKGIDLAAPKGTPVYAAADGKVEIAKFSKSAGNFVMINHRNEYKTQYFHLDKYKVKSGQDVKRGELIGFVGNTGYSTGPHLHYEIRKKNIPLDPKPFLLAYFSLK